MLEVLGWEGRLVVHLEGVRSEGIHVMMVMLLLLHCMCKRVHVRKLRSMEGLRVRSWHGQRSCQTQTKSWSMEVTCLRVVEGVCATRSGGVVAWDVVRKGVERCAVGIQPGGGEAGAAKVPLFRRGCSRGRVSIFDVVMLGELSVMGC